MTRDGNSARPEPVMSIAMEFVVPICSLFSRDSIFEALQSYQDTNLQPTRWRLTKLKMISINDELFPS